MVARVRHEGRRNQVCERPLALQRSQNRSAVSERDFSVSLPRLNDRFPTYHSPIIGHLKSSRARVERGKSGHLDLNSIVIYNIKMTTRGGHLRAWSFKVVIWHVVERAVLTRTTPLNDRFPRSPDPPVYNLTHSVQGKPSSVERYSWSFIFLSSSL